MTVIGFVSAKGAPGVTTTVLGLGSLWTEVIPGRRVLIVEADPAGGEAASGLLRGGVDASRGLLGLAAQRGGDPVGALWGQLVALDESQRFLLLPGLTDPSRTAALDGAWSALAEALAVLRLDVDDVDVLIDLGRLWHAPDPRQLRRAADLRVLVSGSSAPEVVAARAAAIRLREEAATPVGLLVIGPDRPYPPEEVAHACDLPLVGTLPYDPVGARVWKGGSTDRRHGRSPLIRGLRALGTDLADVESPTQLAVRR